MPDLTPIRAAGGVVSRGSAADLEVAVVHRPRYDDWTLPKGKIHDGERAPVAAVREVTEETGLQVVLGRPLPAQGYFVGELPKRVDYWAARADGAGQFTPNAEVDAVEWLSAHTAVNRLTYPRDVATVRAAAAAPIDTVPYVFVRHARAGTSSDWDGDDSRRPLDDVGTKQAAALAALLACFRPGRIVSSPAARCVETVAPYAAEAGLSVEPDPLLAVDVPWPVVRDRMSELLQAESSVAVCAHGENLASMVAWASVALGGPPPAQPALAKGWLWIFHVAKGELVARERHAT